MVQYLLDTNVLIEAMKESPEVLYRLGSVDPTALYISSLTHFELWYGVAKSTAYVRNEIRLQNTLKQFHQCLAFDESDARAAGELRNELQRLKQPIGPYDTLMAGQALARGLTLVTANQREFLRVPGLTIENWLKPPV